MEPSNRKVRRKGIAIPMMVRINSGLLTVNRLFVALLFAVCAAIAVWIWLGIFDNEQPIEVALKNGVPDRTVLTPEVYPGGKLRIKITTIPHRLCETKVDRVLYDGEHERKTITQPIDFTSSAPAELGKPITFIYGIVVPDDAAGGDATYVAQAKYRCTNFQKLFGPIVGDVVTIPFVILKRTDEEQKAYEAVKELLGQPESNGTSE